MHYQIIMGEIFDKYDDINLFEILNKETDDEILSKMKNKTGFPDDILKDLLKITRKTMAKSRRERYRSMENIIKDLEKIRKIVLQEKV
jgi:hypothetical protein